MDNIALTFAARLDTLSIWVRRSTAVVLVMVIFTLDYASGPYLSTSIFYLVPVAYSTWWLDRRAGVIIALLSALSWLATDWLTNADLPSPLLPLWNATVRLGFFLIVAYTLAAVQTARQRQADLLAFIVHDLRSPLGNILMSLELLAPDVAAQADTARLVDMSIGSGYRMLFQINSLLDISRLENGRMVLDREPLAPWDLAQAALAQVATLAANRQITVELDALAAAPPVLADRQMSERILVNLLNNAIKFSPTAGRITVAAQPEPAALRFAVRDEGRGIAAKWQKQVFKKYEQVQARKAGEDGGSGLGLAFCKLAVEAQGGRIGLESRADRPGTVVWFTLPLAGGRA